MKQAEVIQVIRTTLTLRGNGSTTPIRIITQYWSLDGELLAEVDPRADSEHLAARARLDALLDTETRRAA